MPRYAPPNRRGTANEHDTRSNMFRSNSAEPVRSAQKRAGLRLVIRRNRRDSSWRSHSYKFRRRNTTWRNPCPCTCSQPGMKSNPRRYPRKHRCRTPLRDKLDHPCNQHRCSRSGHHNPRPRHRCNWFPLPVERRNRPDKRTHPRPDHRNRRRNKEGSGR